MAQLSLAYAPSGPLPPFVLTPTYLFDMGFPTPSAGGGWLGRSFDPFPIVRNQMMSASPKWTGELPVPTGMTLAADMTSRRLIDREALSRELGRNEVTAAELTLDRQRRRRWSYSSQRKPRPPSTWPRNRIAFETAMAVSRWARSFFSLAA